MTVEIITPGTTSIDPMADRLVGRTYESLTSTEKEMYEHFSGFGDYYWATYDEETGQVTTDLGFPCTEASIMVPLGTPRADAAREITRVAQFMMELPEPT